MKFKMLIFQFRFILNLKNKPKNKMVIPFTDCLRIEIQLCSLFFVFHFKVNESRCKQWGVIPHFSIRENLLKKKILRNNKYWHNQLSNSLTVIWKTKNEIQWSNKWYERSRNSQRNNQISVAQLQKSEVLKTHRTAAKYWFFDNFMTNSIFLFNWSY